MAVHVMEATVAPDVAAVAAYYSCTPGVDVTDLEAFKATHPIVRRDIHPRAARLFGVDPRKPLTADQLANVLTGKRADGAPIPGRRERQYGDALCDLLGLEQDRMPTPAEIRRILSGHRADYDECLPAKRAASFQKRFRALYGAGPEVRADDIIAAVQKGRRFDGGPLRASVVLDALGATKARTSFLDLTLSAPKSLSVAWAVARSHEERAVLYGAHREAVDRTLAVIEGTLGAVRRGQNGRRGREAGHLAWIECPHFTARPTLSVATHDSETGEEYSAFVSLRTRGDPQLHTHVILPTTTVTDTGHVGTVDLAQLAGRVHVWGRLYQANLGTALRRVGVAVSLDHQTGACRLDAIPDNLSRHFSRRSTEGEAAAREYAAGQGEDWDAMTGPRRVAMLKGAIQGDGRAEKKDDLGDLDTWQAEAAELGWAGHTVIAVDHPQPLGPREDRIAVAAREAAALLAREFETAAVLDEARLRVAAASGLVQSGIGDAEEIEAVVRVVLAQGIDDGGPVTLIPRTVRGKHGEEAVRLTTGGHVEREQRLQDLAARAAADTTSGLSEPEIDAGLASAGLDLSSEIGAAQRALAVALGRARLCVGVGVAGSGKTAALAGLTRAWQRQGRRVYGVALAWRQAQALCGAGIKEEDALALAALLARSREGALRLDRGAVVVVDEVGLLSVRDALALLEVQAETGCTIVAVGDPAQGGSVEAGGVIPLLEAAIGKFPILRSSRRQDTAAERELAALARSGETVAVLDRLRDADRARLVPGTPGDVAEAAADLFLARRQVCGEAPLVLVPTNVDARLVGAAIRRRLQQVGEVGPDVIEVDAVSPAEEEYVLPLAVGDAVRLYRRTYAQGTRGVVGVNGSVLTIVEIRHEGLALRDRNGRETFVPWSNLRAGEGGRLLLGTGFATTLAAGQGATTTEAITVAPRGSADMTAGAFYVAMSRHRATCHILFSEGAERQAVAQRRALLDAKPIRSAELWAHAAASLARRDEPETATAFLARAHVTQNVASALFRAGATRLRARREKSLPATVLPARRRVLAVARLLAALRHVVAERAVALSAVAEYAAILVSAAKPVDRSRSIPARPTPRRKPPATPRGPGF